ncbi:MBL fold metallo-hydrolase [Candidatus Pacearchaeota archaeon]|nr:MBL fold metallo-hydrolase [Candidatus Pacearchaeota archaeon]
MEHGYEIDFLPVGDETKSGDAIALRFGNLHGNRNEQAVVVVDGGFTDNGNDIVNHIKKFYGTSIVDIVIATHPHNDHVAGLQTVLEEMEVKALWMHKPWDEAHTNNIAKWFTDGRVTDSSIRESLRKSLDVSRDLEKIASQKEIPITEPFAGLLRDFGFGQIVIAGPTTDFYESLLPDFAGTPDSKNTPPNLITKGFEAVKEVVGRVFENWGLETLDDSGETSAENNTSVITLLKVEKKHLLFTGDAGIPALTNAVDLLEAVNITHNNYHFVQLPHHGSKRNVGPTILNRILGPKLSEDQKDIKKISAFCSCAIKGEPKHPAKKVTNAFKRRGSHVFVTKGGTITHYCNASARRWSSIIPLPFYSEIEDE